MQTNRQRLQEALQLIEQAQKGLNREGRECPSCGLCVRENWSEHQVGETLRGALTRLQRLLNNTGLQPWLDR